jgi:hypothetical protein
MGTLLQAQSNLFNVQNKSLCAITAIVSCNVSGSYQSTISSNDGWFGQCPSGQIPCKVNIDFGNGSEITIYNNATQAPDACDDIDQEDSDSCYDFYFSWYEFIAEPPSTDPHLAGWDS